jgi:hypothetical protein
MVARIDLPEGRRRCARIGYGIAAAGLILLALDAPSGGIALIVLGRLSPYGPCSMNREDSRSRYQRRADRVSTPHVLASAILGVRAFAIVMTGVSALVADSRWNDGRD